MSSGGYIEDTTQHAAAESRAEARSHSEASKLTMILIFSILTASHTITFCRYAL